MKTTKTNANLNTYEGGIVVPQTRRVVKWKCPYKRAMMEDINFYIATHKGLSKIYVKVELRGGVTYDVSQFSGLNYWAGSGKEISEPVHQPLRYGDCIILIIENDSSDIDMTMSLNSTIEILEV